MPSSGGSVSDAPVNKVVDGQSHYLAYITPDEGKSLQQQGGKEVVTDQGIPAYPPPGERGGPGSGSEGRAPGGEGQGEYQSPPSQPSQDTPEDVADTADGYEDVGGPASRTNIEDIHGEHDDPDSVSYDPTYNPVTQAKETKKVTQGSGKHAGKYMWDAKKQEYFRVTDFTWKEHWDKAPDILKMSPTLRAIYATGKNINEWTTRKGWNFDSNTGSVTDDRGNNVSERDLMNAAGSDAPYAASGTTQPTSSTAANWFSNLGSTTQGFNLATEYAAAKSKVAQRLGTSSAVGQLAVNQSSFFNWLKDNSLDKGIL